MTRPAKPKPQAFEEVARVLNIARMIDEELMAMAGFKPANPTGFVIPLGAESITLPGQGWDILAVAERIAARTEG